MDALEFYIGELEAKLIDLTNAQRYWSAERQAEQVLKLKRAAEAVITAWDVENTPPREGE